MTDTTASFYGVTAFDGRAIRRGDHRRFFRKIADGVVFGFGAVAAVGVLVVAVTLAAAWIVNTGLVSNPELQARALMGPGTLALANADPKLAWAADTTFESKWARATAGAAPQLVEIPGHPAKREIVIAQRPIQVAKLAPARDAIVPLPQQRPPERVDSVPLPRAHPVMPEIARAPFVAPAPQAPAQVAAIAPPSPPPAPAEKRVAPREAHNKALALPDVDSRTAVYDISARTVFLPNGEKLEAHSGLYDKLDDPRYVKVRMRGPTPPNVYQLTLREQLFHGVRAIRLNPVDEGKMFGRAGMLAHTYMLGPNGDSNGCVSFKNYDKFLQAFLDGKVNRLVVVPNLGNEPLRVARSRPVSEGRFAANNPPAPFSNITW